MDEEGKFRPDLLREMFELGLMGIDIKEEYGGQGGTFFNLCWRLRNWQRSIQRRQ